MFISSKEKETLLEQQKICIQDINEVKKQIITLNTSINNIITLCKTLIQLNTTKQQLKPITRKRKPGSHYSEEEKQKALDLLHNGVKPAQVAKTLNMLTSYVYHLSKLHKKATRQILKKEQREKPLEEIFNDFLNKGAD